MDGALTSYKKSETLGKSQLDLIIMVFDGAITAFAKAKTALQADDNTTARSELDRARRFVVHLYTTLDTDQGGEIAEQLGKLYTFVINQTSVIEATKDLALIDDNITVLDNVRQGWVDLKNQAENAAEATPKPNRTEKNGGFTTSA